MRMNLKKFSKIIVLVLALIVFASLYTSWKYEQIDTSVHRSVLTWKDYPFKGAVIKALVTWRFSGAKRKLKLPYFVEEQLECLWRAEFYNLSTKNIKLHKVWFYLVDENGLELYKDYFYDYFYSPRIIKPFRGLTKKELKIIGKWLDVWELPKEAQEEKLPKKLERVFKEISPVEVQGSFWIKKSKAKLVSGAKMAISAEYK